MRFNIGYIGSDFQQNVGENTLAQIEVSLLALRDQVEQSANKHQYNKDGNELLFSSRTGKLLNTSEKLFEIDDELAAIRKLFKVKK